jgi:hypothetical protein
LVNALEYAVERQRLTVKPIDGAAFEDRAANEAFFSNDAPPKMVLLAFPWLREHLGAPAVPLPERG